MALDCEQSRRVVELLADIFADALLLTAATAGGSVGLVVQFNAGPILFGIAGYVFYRRGKTTKNLVFCGPELHSCFTSISCLRHGCFG